MGDQPYQQPYQQPPVQPQSAGAKWGPTSIGLEAHIAAGLGYLFSPILPLVFFLIEKNNRFVKFHAMQSILLGIGLWVWIIVVGFVIPAILFAIGSGAEAATNGSGAGGPFALIGTCVGCLAWVGSLAFVAGAIWGLIAGFMGKYTKLPVIGSFAEKWAGGPATPLY